MKKMKPATIAFRILFCVLAVSALLPFAVYARGTDAFSWYCVHVKDHKQPEIDANLSFVEDLGGVYLDRTVDESSSDRVLYLTFDAGYENGNIAKILDVLKAEDVKATFFILENLIEKNPDLIQRMVSEGHILANHTAHHKDMSLASDETLMKEIRSLEETFKNLTGQELSHLYRPPEGRFSKQNLECLHQNGYRTVFWSFGYPDWDNNRQMSSEKAKKVILENIHNGEIMLLHPTSATNAAVLGDVICELKAQGYRFATIAELPDQCNVRTIEADQ